MRTVANITDALASVFEDELSNSINRSVIFAQILDTKPGTGKNVQFDVRFGTATPATPTLADGADVSTFNTDDKIPAVLQYGTYSEAFSVTGKAMAAAAAAGNPDQLADLVGDELMDAIERQARGIAGHCYTGTGATDNIFGLYATSGPLDTTGTYAGIDRGTYAQWASNEVDGGAAALTLAMLRSTRTAIYVASGMRPDFIITDPVSHDKYGALLGSERRYVQDVRVGGRNITLDGGYQALEFDGIPVIADAEHPAGKFSFLNSKVLYLSQLPDAATAANRSSGMVSLHGTDEEQFGDSPVGLVSRINPLAVTGDAYKWQLICYPQLVCRRCNAIGSLINFT